MEKKFDVLCLGMMMYDMLVRPVHLDLFEHDTSIVDPLVCTSGGDAMTESIISARLGAKTGLISKVGADSYGQALLDILDKAGVNKENVKISPEVDTAISLALVQENGDRCFLATPGLNNSTLCVDDFDINVLKSTRFLSYGSMLFMKSMDETAGEKIFRKAREWGVETVVDCAHNVYGMSMNVVLDALPYISIFAPSRVEAQALTGLDDPAEMAAALYDRGCGAVIIKLDAEGCYVRSSEINKRMPAYKDVKVLDTTGAGDNFVGSLLAARSEGRPLEEAIRFAQAAAAISIGSVGATTGLKSREQVLEYMRTHTY